MDNTQPLETSERLLMLKELGDIKAALAVNTTETSNIKLTVAEIKTDLRNIQTAFVTSEEFKMINKNNNDTLQDHEARMRNLESKVWKAIGALAVCNVIILPIILYLIFKQISH